MLYPFIFMAALQLLNNNICTQILYKIFYTVYSDFVCIIMSILSNKNLKSYKYIDKYIHMLISTSYDSIQNKDDNQINLFHR